jgi:predicted peptidase
MIWRVFLITLSLALPAAAADWRELYEKKEHSHEGEILKYRVARLGPESKDPVPLVLFLHGMGERGSDNGKQLTHGMEPLVKWATANKQPCLSVAPQCPGDSWWTASEGDYKKPGGWKLKAEPNAAMQAVLALVDSLVESGQADPKRLYVTGLSMGGYGTFAALARKPELFAAAIPICGGADLSTAKLIKHVPIWIFHGDQDRAVPVELSMAMAKALEEAGGKPRLMIFPGVGHNSWTRAYNNPGTWAWLFAQTK